LLAEKYFDNKILFAHKFFSFNEVYWTNRSMLEKSDYTSLIIWQSLFIFNSDILYLVLVKYLNYNFMIVNLIKMGTISLL
jgi:hypothetical protein